LEANTIRSTRQQQREASQEEEIAELRRFNKNRKVFHEQHAEDLRRQMQKDGQRVIQSRLQMMERVELVREQHTERLQLQRLLAKELKAEVVEQLSRANSEAAAAAEARQKAAAGLFAEKAGQSAALREEVERLRAERRILDQGLRRECLKAAQEHTRLVLQRNLVNRQNNVLHGCLTEAGGREVQLVDRANDQLRCQVKVTESALQQNSHDARERRVIGLMYREISHKSKTPEPVTSAPTHCSESPVACSRTPPLGNTSLPELVSINNKLRAPVLPDPVERQSLAFPTRSEIRRRERDGRDSATTLRFAKRILELEQELRERDHPHLVRVIMQSGGGGPARRAEAERSPLTERSIEHDARVAVGHVLSTADNNRSPGDADRVISCSKRLYDPNPKPVHHKKSKSIATGKVDFVDKTKDKLVAHFYTEAIASHEKCLEDAMERAVAGSAIGKYPKYSRNHLLNTSERLLYASTRNPRHVPVETEVAKLKIANSDFADHFYAKGVEEEREVTRSLLLKYKQL
jgi:hypothetical protein